jgi:hypothetical protein
MKRTATVGLVRSMGKRQKIAAHVKATHEEENNVASNKQSPDQVFRFMGLPGGLYQHFIY